MATRKKTVRKKSLKSDELEKVTGGSMWCPPHCVPPSTGVRGTRKPPMGWCRPRPPEAAAE